MWEITYCSLESTWFRLLALFRALDLILGPERPLASGWAKKTAISSRSRVVFAAPGTTSTARRRQAVWASGSDES